MSNTPDVSNDQNWLTTLTFAVDKMVATPKIMAKLRDLVRRWAEQQSKSDKPVYSCLPHAGGVPTLLEEAAIISAIHDSLRKGAIPINPWGDSGDPHDDMAIADLRHGIAYEVLLQDRLPQILRLDQTFVENWFDDVCKELGAVEPAGDQPDEVGYVEHPADHSAYVSATDILRLHTPKNIKLSLKRLKNITEDYERNHIRWTHPRTKAGKLDTHRRSIHLADWATYLYLKEATDGDGSSLRDDTSKDVYYWKSANS